MLLLWERKFLLRAMLIVICTVSTWTKEFCTFFYLAQLISQPTRVTANSSTSHDVILTTSQVLVIQSDVICTFISDHFPVIVTLNLKKPMP